MEKFKLEKPKVPTLVMVCEFSFIKAAWHIWLRMLEVADRRCFSKYVFLKVSQYTQETPALMCLFNKVVHLRHETLLKRDTNTDVFLWILQNF